VPEASVFQRIRELLDSRGVDYRVVEHGPTRTSEEAARARGESLRVGGKALMLSVDGEFRLLVLSAATKLDSRAVKRHFGAKKTRFATRDELLERTGLEPGAVPPFGEPVLPSFMFTPETRKTAHRPQVLKFTEKSSAV